MEPSAFTLEMIRILPKAALARKYNCSVQYVRKVLQAKDKYNSLRARCIRQDAIEISLILFTQPHTNNIEGTRNNITDDVPRTDIWCVSRTHNYGVV